MGYKLSSRNTRRLVLRGVAVGGSETAPGPALGRGSARLLVSTGRPGLRFVLLTLCLASWAPESFPQLGGKRWEERVEVHLSLPGRALRLENVGSLFIR